jgi:hypothetical protein
VLRLLAPTRGSHVGGSAGAVLRWRAHDADHDRLLIEVQYSTDGHHWSSIFTGSDTGSVTLPSALLSRSNRARVRIRANDGFREAIVTSPPFVALGAPPAVSISSPAPGTRVAAGGTVNLSGSAIDDSGSQLHGRALSWHAGRFVVGRGERVTLDTLPAGRYELVLRACDRFRRCSSAQVLVRVLASRPLVTTLKAPQRVSSRARVVRIRVASLVPAVLRINDSVVLIGRQPRTVRLKVKPGRRTLHLVLVLRSGGFVTRVRLLIRR